VSDTRTQSRYADEVLHEVLEPGQSVVVGQSYGEPRTLLAALSRCPELIEGSEIFIGMALAPLPDLEGAKLRTFFPSGPLGSETALRDLGVKYERKSLYELAHDFESGRQPVDVVLASAAEPQDGRLSVGIAVDYVLAAASGASHLVAEISPLTPWSGDRSLVSDGPRIHTVASLTGPHYLDRPVSDRDEALATHVASWIPDGATLQLGMGPWVAALCNQLRRRRGLRIHTGLLSDWVMRLSEAGALAPTSIMGCGGGGTEAFYRWLDHHDGVQLASATYTHAPATLAAQPQLRAVNSVFEVDLEGRANCELGASGRRGGIAGLSDFATAASLHPEGLSILALNSTRRDASRIVPRLEGPAVSLGPDQVEIVVTEHGSADLRDKSPAQRAEAMIAVADPTYRESLRAGAESFGI
jgi:acyl-CoA hydrolase